MLWLIVCYHITYSLQSESTLYSCLNVMELLARSRRHIWTLSDCNGAQLASLAKWFSIRLRTKWLWVRVPLQSLRMLLFGKFCVFCFLATIVFLRFTLLPYYPQIKAVVSKMILGAVSEYFEKNLLQTNHSFLVFFYFVFLSTFLILLNLFHANNPFIHAAKTSENYRFSRGIKWNIILKWVNDGICMKFECTAFSKS